jgi:hypothetical protein
MPASWPSTFATDQPAVDAATKVSDYTRLRDAIVWLRQLGIERQAFRGLRMRSHPDDDLAASRVYLDHADEIVLEDGSGNVEAVKDWNDIEASMGVLGVGGLDTGAELASTWYKIWATRKPSTGAKGLLLQRSKDWTSDAGQQFTTADDAGRALHLSTGGSPTVELAQGFKTATVGSPGPIVFVDVKVLRTGAVSGRIWLEIQSDNAGDPSGVVLATSHKMNAAVIPTTSSWLRFVFPVPFTAADESTQYHLVMHGSYSLSDTVHITWRGTVAGGYANGVMKEKSGSTGVWSATTQITDGNFRIYTERNDVALVMPTGYDQRAHIGYCRNDGSSNLVPFLAIGKRVVPMKEQTTGTFTSMTALLIDAAVLLPPTPLLVEWSIANATAGNQAGVGGVPDGYVVPDFGAGNFRKGGLVYGYNALGIVASPSSTLPVIATDHQGIYVQVAGSTGQAFLTSWEW